MKNSTIPSLAASDSDETMIDARGVVVAALVLVVTIAVMAALAAAILLPILALIALIFGQGVAGTIGG